MKKLAIITTHPIQYYAPVFKLLHERGKISIMVFYTWGEKSSVKYDPGFGSTIGWDIPLLDGYPYQWMENTSADPGTHHYKGIITPTLINEVEQWSPDAILVFGWAWQSHLRCIRHFKGRIPVYFRGDSTLLDETGGLKSIFKKLFLRWVYRDINKAFYTGSHNKAYFKKYGVKEDRLVFAPHAVDNERFSADRKTEAGAFRQQFNLTNDDILVLFAGKFEDKKSPLELLDAFQKLDKPGAHLLFVGNGALEPELKHRASGSTNIHLTNFQNQSQMPAVLQACDLFCLPSKGPGETWGLAVNEAMACGKAVMVSDKVGCAADLVKENRNGGIFSSGDPAGMAQCLDKLTSSKTRLQEIGIVSAELIRDWDFVHIAEAIEQTIAPE